MRTCGNRCVLIWGRCVCVRGVSHHGFDLGAWVGTHGGDRYVAMLEELAELVNASKIQLDLRTPNHPPLACPGTWRFGSAC